MLCVAETEWSFEASERFRLSSVERIRGVIPVPELSFQSPKRLFPPLSLEKKCMRDLIQKPSQLLLSRSGCKRSQLKLAIDPRQSQTMLHKIIQATLIVLLMTEAVSAQMPKPGLTIKDDKPSRSKEQKEYDKAIDSDYQSAIKKIPEQKKSDPWGDIRSTAPAATKK